MKTIKPLKKKKNKPSGVMEPHASYHAKDENRSVYFFSSFEEENEYVAKERAALSYDERMTYAEELRKRIFSNFLLSADRWKPIAKVFKIMPPYTNEVS